MRTWIIATVGLLVAVVELRANAFSLRSNIEALNASCSGTLGS